MTGSSHTWPVAQQHGRPERRLADADLAHRYVEGADWEYSEFSLYDLGQAVAHMTLQTQALGVTARQFRAFNRDGLAAEFAVPKHWEVTTMMAVGRGRTEYRALAHAGAHPYDASAAPRRQRHLVAARLTGHCHSPAYRVSRYPVSSAPDPDTLGV